jgi:hypothetical protein
VCRKFQRPRREDGENIPAPALFHPGAKLLARRPAWSPVKGSPTGVFIPQWFILDRRVRLRVERLSAESLAFVNYSEQVRARMN